MHVNHRTTSKTKRTLRVRVKVRGTAERPRLNVYRSNKDIYLQIIDDQAAKTIASVSSLQLKLKGKKMEKSVAVATKLAEQLKKAKIKKLVFDRGGYRYHGRVKAVADTMREQGLEV